ncbi:MAG: tetratricopeptide repeat protein [Rhodovarius sp.]|nr:tetratricopeptide repeat protein [Rhodovarius sp.]
MLLLLLPLALLAFLPPAAAQPAGPRPPSASQTELDRAFAALRDAPDEEGALLVERRILQLFSARATPAVALLLARGQRNLAAGQPEDALEDFDAAITLAPNLPEAWLGRALAHHAAGQLAAALADLQHVLRLEPRHWIALDHLSRWQAEAGNHLAALRSFEAVLAIHPKLRGGQQRLQDLRRRALGEDA